MYTIFDIQNVLIKYLIFQKKKKKKNSGASVLCGQTFFMDAFCCSFSDRDEAMFDVTRKLEKPNFVPLLIGTKKFFFYKSRQIPELCSRPEESLRLVITTDY